MNHVTEQHMYDLVDGELTAEESKQTIAHVSSCKKCKKILAEIMAVEEGIRYIWESHLSKSCPHEDTLFAYFEGRLHGHDRESVKKHIEECPICGVTLRIAKAAQEKGNALERANKEFAPSLIERLKSRLDGVEVKGLLDDVAKILVPSKLGEDLFTFLSDNIEVLTYPFKTPLETPALLPVATGGVKLADTGKGFQRKIVTEEGIPFEVELVQFGERFTLNLKTTEEAYDEALIRYSLLEGTDERRRGVFLVSEGKATVSFSEAEIETLRPNKSPLKLNLKVLLKVDVISKITAGDVVSLLERLQALILSEDPETSAATIEILKKIETLIPE
jgi:hypothetical protein